MSEAEPVVPARFRGAAWVAAGAVVAALLLGVSGQMGPLFAALADEDGPARTPTGFPGEWVSVTDATVVGATAFSNVSLAWKQHFHTPGGYLRANVPYAYLQPSDELRGALENGTAGPIRVRAVVLDDHREWETFGYVLKPGEARDVRTYHQWLGTGSGAWRTEEFYIPGGVAIDGWFYVSLGTTVQSLEFVPSEGSAPGTA